MPAPVMAAAKENAWNGLKHPRTRTLGDIFTGQEFMDIQYLAVLYIIYLTLVAKTKQSVNKHMFKKSCPIFKIFSLGI